MAGLTGAAINASIVDLGNRFRLLVNTVDVVTPATVTLEKSQENITVHCVKECFQDGAGIVTSFTEGLAAGNIIAGGVIGLGIDAASGAMNKYAPETIIVMTPIQGCRATG